MMKRSKCMIFACITTLFIVGTSCAPTSPPPPVEDSAQASTPAQKMALPAETEKDAAAAKMQDREDTPLPVRFQKPTYQVGGKDQAGFTGIDERYQIKVGADISSREPIPLNRIIKQLAKLKNMNVSWASDVQQTTLVDVDIRAEDDFFTTIDNMLRQLDYFHELNGNTIIVKYKDTKRFQIPLPHNVYVDRSSVGGSRNEGYVTLKNEDMRFDIWEDIKTNLDKILEIWSQRTSLEATGLVTQTQKMVSQEQAVEAEQEVKTDEEGANQETQRATGAAGVSEKAGKGYYTIDPSIGLIIVTAPQSSLFKIEKYLKDLERMLFRQVTIEAKVVEVVLADESRSGIDWTGLLSSGDGTGSVFDFQASFGNININNPLGNSRLLTLNTKSFSLLLNALNEQGDTRVLSNPKLTVMNGQPAVLSVGDDRTYISKVEVTVEDNTITTSATTSQLMTGVLIGVKAIITDNDEIVLNLVPTTSTLQSLENVTFGGGAFVGLPHISKRELNTTVRMKNGEILVIGGLIDSRDVDSGTKVPILGDLPIINRLFKNDVKTKNKTELVILLQPKIVS